MSGFQRKGTISKASGPTYINSYALAGVPIKYNPPVFVPDLMRLPANWTISPFPSEDMFRYDFNEERRVLDQAELRSLSVVAEANQREQEKRRERERAESQDSADSQTQTHHLLFTLDSTILTPTQAASSPPASANSEDNLTTTAGNGTIKSLGQLSIREFEGDNFDPFELASLQAINDMAELQSVLQPVVCPALPPSISEPTLAPPVMGNQPLITDSPLPSSSSSSSSSSAITLPVASISAPVLPSSSSSVIPPVQQRHTSSEGLSTRPVLVDPTTAPQFDQPVPTSTMETGIQANPFLVRDNACVLPPHSQNTPNSIQPQAPSVGTLIEIDNVTPRQPPVPAQRRPVPTPRRPPQYSATPPSSSSPSINPSPHGHLNGPLSHSSSDVMPPQVPPKPHPSHSPNLQVRGGGGGANPSGLPVPPDPTRTPSPTGSRTSPSIQERTNILVANLPPIHNRPGLGVPVLPPIQQPLSSDSAPLPAPRTHTPPPPYFAEQEAEHAMAPQPAPRRHISYSLPNPLLSMSGEERDEVQSIAGMGFPPARVARAYQRYSKDRTKILDFLILVGTLEDLNFNGDSGETALLANNDDTDKAIEYLKRVDSFKEIGFQEQAIHEAYKTSNSDWDKALDILIQER